MRSTKCNLTELLHCIRFRMSRNLYEMHRSVGKITDGNVLLFSSQTKFALKKAANLLADPWSTVWSHLGQLYFE